MTNHQNRSLRVGVAGLGFGATVHAPALLSQPGVEFVGIAGRSAETAKRVADSLGIAHACSSVEALLDLHLDAVTLALPPDQVAPAVRLVLRRNVALLCEKPLGVDAAEAVGLAVLGGNVVTAVDFQFGELTTFARLKQIICSGLLGRVRHVDVTWLTESWANRNRVWSWKTDKERGGGVMSLLGSHLFFLAEWLVGPIVTVNASAVNTGATDFCPVGKQAAEDLMHCRMKFSVGAVCSAVLGNANPGCSIHRWIVVFDKGAVVLENLTNDYVSGFHLNVLGGSFDGEQCAETAAAGEDGRLLPFRRLLERFLDGVRMNRPVQPDLAAGARALVIDNAVRTSVKLEAAMLIPTPSTGLSNDFSMNA